MTAITIQDLDNAKVDVDHIADIATSVNPTATDRLDRGVWAASTGYTFGDVATVSGVPYQAAMDHTSSSSFSTDRAANKWFSYLDMAIRPVVLGGTGADNPGDAIANLGLININDSIELTGATTMSLSYLGKLIILKDSGTPADYTVTLPSSAPLGSLIALRVDDAATRLYTINGGDSGLNGLASQVMWRGETVLLVKDAGKWTKMAREKIPFRGVLQLNATQAIAAGSWVKVAFAVDSGDPTLLALCFDAGNTRFKAPRRGSYSFSASLAFSATVSVASCLTDVALSLNGGGNPTAIPSSFVRQTYPVGGVLATMPTGGLAFPMNPGGYVELLGRISGAGSTIASPRFEYSGSLIVPSLSYVETPLW